MILAIMKIKNQEIAKESHNHLLRVKLLGLRGERIFNFQLLTLILAYSSETNFRYMFSMIALSRKVMNSSKLQGNGLCVIKETLEAKSTGKPYQSGVASYTKSTTSAAFRSASRVPIFHTVSVSKNQGCAKNIV